jgi:hypothetical protein
MPVSDKIKISGLERYFGSIPPKTIICGLSSKLVASK